MLRSRNTHRAKLFTGSILGALICALSPAFTFASNPPMRCAGYGDLQSISLSDWEAGLGSWSASTHDVSNPPTFDTPDWAAVDNLPDGRTGMAAFVANLDSPCAGENEIGALALDSPTIVIPAGTLVPRISIEHWFATEYGWDGGNFKISVNGGGFTQVPASAIEYGAYNATLFPAFLDFLEYNSNPLADEDAFSGTNDGQQTGSWDESHINLLGIAAAGDSIKLRFDFGIDECGGAVGWFVDDVEIYSCEAELLPSDCGNGDLDQGEQCDDGNNFIGDGCSNICEIEDGWQCSAPAPAGAIPDPGFEDGTPNGFWTEVSNSPLGTPICEVSVCGLGTGSGPADGDFWAWFGGVSQGQESSLTQSAVFPPTVTELTFDLEIPICDSASDYVEVLIDGNLESTIDGASSLCDVDGYSQHAIDISSYADGGSHEIKFHSETFALNGGVTNFFIDNVALPKTVSMCRREGTNLTLIKSVVNDNQGTAGPADWTLTASGPTGFSGSGPVVVSGEIFDPGTYNLSEAGPNGYAASDWVCSGGLQNSADSITLALGEAASCTIINDDIAPSITVSKTIINDNGGAINNPDAFGLQVNGSSVLDGEANLFNAGAHTVSETGLPGYQAGDWGGDCDPDGSITLSVGQAASCTITNDDISPTLTVIRTITNDNGGLIDDPDLFGLKINGDDALHNIANQVDADSYVLSEVGQAGYQSSVWGGDCNPDGSITLLPGEQATCLITSDDVTATLSLHKTIINNNGGAVVDKNAFGLRVDSVLVLHAAVNEFDAGNHTVSEDGLSGYLPGAWGGDCSPDGNITLALGQNASCTITNDDTDDTSLTLVNQVVNDNGGGGSGADWTLTASGPTTFSGQGPNVSSGEGFSAGSYNLSQTNGPAGYLASNWVCIGGTQSSNSVTLDLGEAAICTISNNDISPTLTIIKSIVNDNNGTVTNPNAFNLRVDGGTVLNNASNEFDAGFHTASEDGLSGYQAGPWGGDCDPDGTITLALDEHATCTISNDDIQPTLTLIKTIINDDGGTISNEDDFGLMVDAQAVQHNISNAFDVGPHNVSEVGLPGYLPGVWGGDCNEDGSITLALGDNATCTITNDDIPPTLTVLNTIINDNGGTVTDKNLFALKVDGASVEHNVTNEFDVGAHSVSQQGLNGYQAGSWGGDCDATGNVSLASGQNAVCTISNDDITPTLAVLKTIISDNGGTVTDPDEFVFRVDGNVVNHSEINQINAGNHTVSEDGLPGYLPGNWGGDCNADGTITLALAQVATCSITNDDVDTTTLTLIKQVINDNGGSASGSDWTLEAVGPTPFNGTGPNVSSGPGFSAGTYQLSESGGSPHYAASNWICVGGTQNGADSITLTLGEAAICTITNDDISPTLKVVKSIINDNGGLITDPNLFDLQIDGQSVQNDNINQVNAGNHIVSEQGQEGYQAGTWGGDCDTLGNITLSLGDNATCSITNDDISPTLTVVNTIINNDGGMASDPDSFDLQVDGGSVQHGASNVLNAGFHTVSAAGVAGYQASIWGGDCHPDGSINLTLNQNAICSISNDDISPTITVVSTIVNDNGGDITDPDAFGLRVDGGSVLNGENNPYQAGVHTVTSDGLNGYQASVWGGDCSANGNITLELAQNAICSMTNNDISATLTVIKTIINDDGGTIDDENVFVLKVDGNAVQHNISNDFDAGVHQVSETGLPTYLPGDWGGDCDSLGNVTLALGEAATCTISNDDIAPTLTVINNVINDNGGLISDANAFGLRVNGGSVLNNVGNNFNAGPQLVSADGLSGYQAGEWSGDCDADGNVTLALNQNATCSVTYNDITPTLTLVKSIVNDNGGTIVDADAFGLTIDDVAVLDRAINEVDAGGHMASEVGLSGYLPGDWGGDCDPDGSIELILGQQATCTITNDDITPTLTVFKTIISDNGGTVTNPSAFGLRVDGISVLHNTPNDYDAGEHLVSEDGLAGYIPQAWGGDCLPDGSITLTLGQNATCTISNDDSDGTSLTLMTVIVNDNGGSANADQWTLSAAGATGFSGAGPSVSNAANFSAGSYELSLSGGPPGYQASDWHCAGGTQNDSDTVTLALADVVACTITLDDQQGSITLVKSVVNDSGGTVTNLNAFGLRVDGGLVSHNASNKYDAGVHLVTEDGLPNYKAGLWGGDCNADGSITLALAQQATCTITNDDIEFKELIFKNSFEEE